MAITTQSVNGSNDTVDSHHSDCISWVNDSLLPRSLMGGTKGMKAQGKTFLPQDYLEKDGNYQTRLQRSILVNAYGKTVSFLGGQVFQKDIVFEDSTPEEVIERNKDIDLAGSDVDTFAKKVFEKGISEGVVHIIVDTNNKGTVYNSKAEEKEAGIRPYFRMVSGENLIGYIDEEGTVVQVRIMEMISVRDGLFGVNNIEQIRVLQPGEWATYRQSGKNTWTMEDSGTTNLPYIPLVSFIPGEKESPVTGKTPLMDLAELGLNHWQSKSDQDNILHHARVPKLFGKMLDIKAMEESPHSLLVSNDEHGDLKYVEITGKAIESGQKDLTEIEAKMAMWGLQQLIPRTGNQTATEKALTSSESNSSLGSWASIFESSMREAFAIAGDYESTTFPEDLLTVNREFTVGILDPEMVRAYIEMVEAGILSATTAFAEIKRKGFISEDLDWLEVSAEIMQERQQSSIMPDNFDDDNNNEGDE